MPTRWCPRAALLLPKSLSLDLRFPHWSTTVLAGGPGPQGGGTEVQVRAGKATLTWPPRSKPWVVCASLMCTSALVLGCVYIGLGVCVSVLKWVCLHLSWGVCSLVSLCVSCLHAPRNLPLPFHLPWQLYIESSKEFKNRNIHRVLTGTQSHHGTAEEMLPWRDKNRCSQS